MLLLLITAKPPQGPTFWAKFSDPGVGPLGGTFKIFPYREFFPYKCACLGNMYPSPDRRFDQSFLRKASLDAPFCLSSHRSQRLSLVSARWSFFLGCAFWRCFAPSEGHFLVFGRLLGYALQAAYQTLVSVLWRGLCCRPNCNDPPGKLVASGK